MSTGFAPRRISPQLRQSSTTRAMMLDVIVALTPALGMAIFFFGPRAVALTAVSVGSCLVFEFLYRLLTRQKQSVTDLSACVTGLLLALSLPASAPYWVPVMGAAFAIIVVKQFYGGLGRNFMNPALAGRMLAGTLPLLMTTWPPLSSAAPWRTRTWTSCPNTIWRTAMPAAAAPLSVPPRSLW